MKNFSFIFLLLFTWYTLHAQDDFTYTLFGDGIGFTEGFDVIETSDGGYFLIGSKGYQDFSNAQEPWAIKLDQDFGIDWEFEMDFAAEGFYDFGVGGIEMEDGYVVLGYFNDMASFNDYSSLMKLDFDGNLLWSTVLEYGDGTSYSSIFLASDGNFIISGSKRDSPSTMLAMAKLEGDGNMLWERKYPQFDFTGGLVYEGDATEAPDGGILFTLGSAGMAVLLKTDAEGNLIWHTEMAAETSGMSVKVLENGEIVVLCSQYSDGDFSAVDYLVHLSPDGDVIKETLINDNIIESARDMTIDADGNVYISGVTAFNAAILLKTDLSGDTLWTKTFASDIPEIPAFSFDGINLTSDGHLVLAGAAWIPVGLNNLTPGYFYLVKLTLDGGMVSSVFHPFQKQDNIFRAFPIPANDRVNFISENEKVKTGYLQLYDQMGRRVKSEPFSQNQFEIKRDGLPNGTYAYYIYSASGKLLGTGQLIFK